MVLGERREYPGPGPGGWACGVGAEDRRVGVRGKHMGSSQLRSLAKWLTFYTYNIKLTPLGSFLSLIPAPALRPDVKVL